MKNAEYLLNNAFKHKFDSSPKTMKDALTIKSYNKGTAKVKSISAWIEKYVDVKKPLAAPGT